jgi:hypothetical protein
MRAIGTPGYPTSIAEAKRHLFEAKQRKLELKQLRSGNAGAKRQNIVANVTEDDVDGQDKHVKKKRNYRANNTSEGFCISAEELKSTACAFCGKVGHLAQQCYKLERAKVAGKLPGVSGNNSNNNNADNNNKPSSSSPDNNNKDKKKKLQQKKKRGNKLRNNKKKEPQADNHNNEELHAHMMYGFTLPALIRKHTAKKVTVNTVIEDSSIKGATILDNGANICVVNDKSLLNNLRKTAPIMIQGVSKQKVTSNVVGSFMHFGTAYYVPESPFNIVSFRQAKEKFNMSYDNNDDVFIITSKSRGVHRYVFKHNSGTGLYHLQVGTTTKKMNVAAPIRRIRRKDVPIGNGDVQNFVLTPEQIERADAVQIMHNVMQHPSDDALAILLDENGFPNCPLTSQDLKNLRTLRGPCTQCDAAKTTQPTVNKKSESPPPPHCGHTLHMDIVLVAKQPMLLSVEGLYGYAHLIPLPTKSTKNILLAMDEIIAFYKSYGKEVKVLRSDSKSAFKACKVNLNQKGVRCYWSAPGCHEHRVERFVKLLRERTRAVMQTVKSY